MKKIGFVDYYISEWHANHYPAWIKTASEKMGEDFTVAYAWAEEFLSPVYNETTDQWCEKFGVTKCDTLEELCEKSDYIVILSPSNPEKHPGYAEKVLSYGKNTYIDKTFAPDYETAKKIFDMAEKNGTKFFSSSALRYASELDGLSATRVETTGGGGNIAEYIIHQAEMVVKVLRAEPTGVSVKQTEDGYECEVSFEGGKSAKMTYAPKLPFALAADGRESVEIKSDFFLLLISDMLRFFAKGTTSFDEKETLQVMKLREAVVRAVEEL